MLINLLVLLDPRDFRLQRNSGSAGTSAPPVGFFGKGNGAVMKLLQRGKKGKDAVRNIMVLRPPALRSVVL